MQGLNERFTDIADWVSQKIGEWPITAFAIACLVIWIILGPLQGFSDTWQLEANTPTTWIELFIGFLCAAATNRAEKHLRQALERISALEQTLDEHINVTAKAHAEKLDANTELTREIHRLVSQPRQANGRFTKAS